MISIPAHNSQNPIQAIKTDLSVPFVGVTVDEGEPGTKDQDQNYSYSKVPWYVVRKNYCEAIARAGAIPIMLPYYPEYVEDYLNLCSAIVVTGGGFDIDPTLFGASHIHASVTVKPQRTQFEWALIKGAYERKMPVLGICGGMQLLNVVLGGTLIQHIPDEISTALVHKTDFSHFKSGHSVTLTHGSTLKSIIGHDRMEVNTNHHQAISRVAHGLRVNAVAPDGVIEGVESAHYDGCLGLQWHPEHWVNSDYAINDSDHKIFTWFVEKAQSYRQSSQHAL